MNQATSTDTSSSTPRSWLRRLTVGLLAFALPVLALAQAGNGIISGRVFNPATNEYIRNAEIRVQGTNLVTNSGDGGYYELRNVPPGAAPVVASYPGPEAVTATLNVSSGAQATRDFELSLTSSHR